MRYRHLFVCFAVISSIALTGGPLGATIFATLPSVYEAGLRATEERLGVNKSVETGFGVARVDESKDPPEIAVGELRSLWKGLWQLSGAKLNINRALATDLVLQRASASFRVKVRWVAGNEAVARSADHTFQMKIFRMDGDAETVVETIKKDVTVGKKGLGKTVFKDGHLFSSKIPIAGPAKYRISLRARSSNSDASLETSTILEFKK